MKLNLGCGDIKLEGFENLDIESGFDVRSEFPYPDKSIEGITASHIFCVVDKKHYPTILEECYRVLQDGGVIRIADDNHSQTLERFHELDFDNPEFIGSTSPTITRKYLEEAGFEVFDVGFEETHFKDESLIQVNYNRVDKSIFFHIEGVKNDKSKK